MNSLWLYVILLWILVVISFKKKWNYIGKMILILYAVISVFSLLAPKYGNLLYAERLDPNAVSYSTILFLVGSYCLFFSPFFTKKESFSPQKMNIALNDNYSRFALLYICLCVITIVLYIKPMISLLQSGQWALNRKIMATDEAVYPYNNFIEKLIINCTNYFKVLALIIGFLLIVRTNKKKTGFFTIVFASITEIITDLYVSSRGSIAVFALFFIAMLMFFSPDINTKSIVRFGVLVLVGIFIIWPLLQDITVSRFSDSASSSVFYYLGQPPYGLTKEIDNLDQHMYGKFAFGTLFGDEKFPDELSSWVHTFYTFVGWLYADWGYIGTIVIGIIISIVLGMIIKKNNYTMADLFLLFSYFKLLTTGVFTVGRTKSNMIIISLSIYCMLKLLIDKYRIVIRK